MRFLVQSLCCNSVWNSLPTELRQSLTHLLTYVGHRGVGYSRRQFVRAMGYRYILALRIGVRANFF